MRASAALLAAVTLLLIAPADGVFTKDRKGNPVASRGAAAQARIRQQQAARVAANARANAAKAKAAAANRQETNNPGTASTAWTAKLTAKISAPPLVLDANNVIYGTEDQKIACVNAQNGRVMWTFATQVKQPPHAVAGGPRAAACPAQRRRQKQL